MGAGEGGSTDRGRGGEEGINPAGQRLATVTVAQRLSTVRDLVSVKRREGGSVDPLLFYVMAKEIGKGSFGAVKLATHVVSGAVIHTTAFVYGCRSEYVKLAAHVLPGALIPISAVVYWYEYECVKLAAHAVPGTPVAIEPLACHTQSYTQSYTVMPGTPVGIEPLA